ncbi:hypothetical protein M407DRAFT_84155, partial [Tulasnella calospora MUT 4182]
MALTYRDLEHPTETLAEFGNRVVDGSRKLRDLLPEERKIVPATVTAATAKCKTDGNHVVDVTQGTLTDASLGPGFNTSVFVDELAINVILIGLGRSEDVQQLKHSLLQTGLNSLNDVLNALQKEDTLRKSDEIGAAGSSALAARQAPKPTSAPREKGKFYCKKHLHNKSHNTEDCKVLNPPSASAKAASEGETERAMAAGVKKIASPPTLRTANSNADTYWNADSGATTHMTPHREWIRDMQP